jgi:DNA-binding PadR family transcriptional regulator
MSTPGTRSGSTDNAKDADSVDADSVDDHYEQTLLTNWEEVYKRGQLTLWVLLALSEGPKNMVETRAWLQRMTHGTITVEERSLYRVLQRFHTAELVNLSTRPGAKGPDQKIYSLSAIGQRVLQQFIERNIALFLRPEIQGILAKAKSR